MVVVALETGSSRASDGDGREQLVQLLVPIYNEGENVIRLYESLRREHVEFDELCFVYDIVDDTSLPYIAKLSATDPRVSAEKNDLGKGVVFALRWGFSHARPGPVIVLMGDNSDKLSIIGELVLLWRQGATIVSPSRYMPGGRQHGGPPLKTFLSRFAGKFIKMCGFPTADPTNNFKLYDGLWLARQHLESTGGFEAALELSFKAYTQGTKIVEVPTEWFDRTAGESRFRLWAWLPKYLYWYCRILAALVAARIKSVVSMMRKR